MIVVCTLEQFSVLVLCVTSRVLSNLGCKFIMSNTLLYPNTERLERGSRQGWGPLCNAAHKHIVRNIPYSKDFLIQSKMQNAELGGKQSSKSFSMRRKVQYLAEEIVLYPVSYKHWSGVSENDACFLQICIWPFLVLRQAGPFTLWVQEQNIPQAALCLRYTGK